MTETQRLYESYFAVYNDEVRETLSEEVELLEDINYLYDGEIEEIVEETIEAMLEEGYELLDIEEALDEIFSEATVTKGRGNYVKLSTDKHSAPVTVGHETARRQASAPARMQARKQAVISAARQRQVQAVKDAPGKAVARVRKAVDTAAAGYAARHGLQTDKRGRKMNQNAIMNRQGSKDPSVRRGIRSQVVGHLATRAANKLQRGVEKVKGAVQSTGQRAVTDVKTAGDTAQAKMRSAGSAAKKTGGGFLGRVARKVSTKAGNLASRLGEDVDVYDVVLDHLLEEGYADTVESAENIMVNMSEDWIDVIVEGFTAPYPERPQSPKTTKLPRSREANIGRHNDWKDNTPTEWDGKTSEQKKAAKLKSRLNAVVGTQRRQDAETGSRRSYDG
jgi:hypothetical protein